MSINLPKESEGLGRTAAGLPWGPPLIAPTPGVNDGSAALVDGFTPTRYELAVLAQHYAEKKNQIDFQVWQVAQVGSSEWRSSDFAAFRMHTILQCLGDAEFDAVVGPIDQVWQDRYAAAEEECVRCTRCGVLFTGSLDDACPSCHVADAATKDLDPWRSTVQVAPPNPPSK
jgi:hypothetical protein